MQCKKPASDDGRRLAVITRLKKRLNSLLVAKAIDEQVFISEAWNVDENPIDPCPENVDAWLQHEYPKDENGESIRHQIDKTIKSERARNDDRREEGEVHHLPGRVSNGGGQPWESIDIAPHRPPWSRLRY